MMEEGRWIDSWVEQQQIPSDFEFIDTSSAWYAIEDNAVRELFY